MKLSMETKGCAEVVGKTGSLYTDLWGSVQVYFTFLEPETAAFLCHSMNLSSLDSWRGRRGSNPRPLP